MLSLQFDLLKVDILHVYTQDRPCKDSNVAVLIILGQEGIFVLFVLTLMSQELKAVQKVLQ